MTTAIQIRKKYEKICELVHLALFYKELGHDLFIEYHAHVDMLTIRLYIGGWDIKKEPIFKDEIYLSGPDYDDALLDDILGALRYQLAELENKKE